MSYIEPSTHPLRDFLLEALGIAIFIVLFFGGVGFGVLMLVVIIAWHHWWLFALPLVPIEMGCAFALLTKFAEG
jgi:hypothetical protein